MWDVNTTIKARETFWVWIYVAGDPMIIKYLCQEYCETGLCVTVEPLDFIYKGGHESGARIGLINYPRFPATKNEIRDQADKLANWLWENLYQDSVLIMDSESTRWYSRRG